MRDWLAPKTNRTVASGTPLMEKHQRFREDLPALCQAVDWVEAELTFGEQSSLVSGWLNAVEP